MGRLPHPFTLFIIISQHPSLHPYLPFASKLDRPNMCLPSHWDISFGICSFVSKKNGALTGRFMLFFAWQCMVLPFVIIAYNDGALLHFSLLVWLQMDRWKVQNTVRSVILFLQNCRRHVCNQRMLG